MSSGFVMILLFVLSEAIGVALGEWFFHLFLKAVPPVAMSQFNAQSSRLFKAHFGQTPSEFRRQSRQRQSMDAAPKAAIPARR